MLFTAHGRYDIQFHGEVVSLTFKGNWNLEQAKAFFLEYKAGILERGLGGSG